MRIVARRSDTLFNPIFAEMPIIVVGLSPHTAPVALRERFAFAEARVPAVLQRLRESRVADEAVIVSTCNRVELYAATGLDPQRAIAALRDFLLDCHDYHDPLAPPTSPPPRPASGGPPFR